MDFASYALVAARTALYPRRGANLEYPALGVVGESGEVSEKVLGGDVPGLLTELGDVCWYVAALAAEAGLDPSGLRSAPASPDSLERLGLLLSVRAGRAAERVKKVGRDDAGVLSDEVRTLLASDLSLVLGVLAALAEAVGSSLSYVTELNAEKLASRSERGVLSGSGDER